MVCIARKTLYSHVYFVCTHTKYMVSGGCTAGVCTAQICRVHTAPGCFHTNQHVKMLSRFILLDPFFTKNKAFKNLQKFCFSNCNQCINFIL